MATNAERREQLRPQGLECLGCTGCQFHELCGGYFNGRLFGNCFEELCCHFTGKDKKHCNAVCPYKADFDGWLADTHGLSLEGLPVIKQNEVDLPLYVPLIDHASSRIDALDWPVVALKTYAVLGVRRASGRYEAIADSPATLRRSYLLAENTKVVLRGIAGESELEPYWENRIPSDAPGQLARLNVHAAIGPNFSHYLDVPRTDHLYNKQRQLICLAELAAAGIPVVPHLNSVMPGDWTFWQRYLEVNPLVNVVAIEFQTGNKTKCEGRKVIDQLATIQARLHRSLHLILVGGAQFLEYSAARFVRLSLIDSMPFHKTMRRFHFEPNRSGQPWREGFTLVGQKLDDLLLENIAGYSAWVGQRVESAK